MRFALGMILLCSFVGGCSYVNKVFKLKDDNFSEEIVEDLIEGYFDLPPDSIDLTP